MLKNVSQLDLSCIVVLNPFQKSYSNCPCHVILLVYSYIIKTIPFPIGHSTFRQLEVPLDLSYPPAVGPSYGGYFSVRRLQVLFRLGDLSVYC